jgi:hypothetical protein
MLSELASDDDLRARFRKVAANYLAMARAEFTRAKQGMRPRSIAGV